MGAQAFADWLKDAVGDMKIVDDSWAVAIRSLGAPTFTTNYDTLYETVAGVGSSDWLDPKGFQQILAGASTMGHLHGVHTHPESVVLTQADYQRLALSVPAQDLQKAISSTKSVVYIGCGGTLDDPNFSALLEWHRETFKVSGVTHYRLCLDSEVADLNEIHRNDNIFPIGYGHSYGDLANFLATVAPSDAVVRTDAGVVRDAVGESREYLIDQLRAETILGEGRLDLDERSIADLTIAPVLLPVPHAEYLRLRGSNGSKPERIDPETESKANGVILLVGDENAGLSTAIRWLLCEASTFRTRSAPLLLDFRRFPSGLHPLLGQTRLEAVHRGIISNKRDELPPVVVGVDNFHAHSKTSVRMLEDAQDWSGLLVIGCHSNFEGETLQALKDAGIDVRVRYLGKLGASDVRAMAKLASPAHASSLADSVMSTLSAEHLPRTPFTVALLLAIMMRGEALVANASPTTILEQYVSHLLGRDEADQDPRFQLTSADRESILTDLAQLFVETDQGSMLQSVVIERMEQFFSRFAWSESPTEVLGDLVARRVLSFDGSQVRFTQSSFLHLFAAKAAAKKSELRSLLLTRPLYYSPVIRAYAAIVRHDTQLLSDLQYLADSTIELDGASSAFARLDLVAAPADLEGRFLEIEVSPPPIREADKNDDPPEDYFDTLEDKDILPFPLTTDEDLSVLARFTQSIDLLSAVLRDSDEVDDLDLKTSVLSKVLIGWGHLVDAFAEDEAFQEMIRSIREAITNTLDDEELKNGVESFLRILPAVVVWSGIAMSLASRKLILILERALRDGDLKADSKAAIPAAILVQTIKDPDWVAKVSDLIAPHKDVWIVKQFLVLLLIVEFEEARGGSEQEKDLRALISDIYVSGYSFPTAAQRKAVATAYGQAIDKTKLSHSMEPPISDDLDE